MDLQFVTDFSSPNRIKIELEIEFLKNTLNVEKELIENKFTSFCTKNNIVFRIEPEQCMMMDPSYERLIAAVEFFINNFDKIIVA